MSELNNSNNIENQIEQLQQLITTIKSEISKVLVGQQNVVEEVIIALLSGGHVLIEGVPGLGKTLLVKALAKCFGGTFARIQFTPDLMPHDITGHAIYDAKVEQFKIRRGPIFCNFLLADEINRAPAKTQSALLEVMQESQATIEGKALKLELPFMTLATENPIESEGTYPLPEAQLDRFLLKIFINYPEQQEEYQLTQLMTSHNHVSGQLNVDVINTVCSIEELLAAQKIITTSVIIDQTVLEYAVTLCRKTRDHFGIAHGAGPRASIALIKTAKAKALLAGRTFVIPDDIKEMIKPVLRHRIRLSADMQIENRTADDILTNLVNSQAAPRE